MDLRRNSALDPVPDRLLVELERLGNLSDRQELVHGARFCPGVSTAAGQTAARSCPAITVT
jgi:hypothetical protein